LNAFFDKSTYADFSPSKLDSTVKLVIDSIKIWLFGTKTIRNIDKSKYDALMNATRSFKNSIRDLNSSTISRAKVEQVLEDSIKRAADAVGVIKSFQLSTIPIPVKKEDVHKRKREEEATTPKKNNHNNQCIVLSSKEEAYYGNIIRSKVIEEKLFKCYKCRKTIQDENKLFIKINENYGFTVECFECF